MVERHLAAGPPQAQGAEDRPAGHERDDQVRVQSGAPQPLGLTGVAGDARQVGRADAG